MKLNLRFLDIITEELLLNLKIQNKEKMLERLPFQLTLFTILICWSFLLILVQGITYIYLHCFLNRVYCFISIIWKEFSVFSLVVENWEVIPFPSYFFGFKRRHQNAFVNRSYSGNTKSQRSFQP